MNDLFGERASWTDLTQDIISHVGDLPINWVGNKKKLIKPILKFLHDSGVAYETVLDVFSGSGVFSLAMIGEGKTVHSNDALLVSSTWLLSLLEYRDNLLSLGEAMALTGERAGKHDLDFLRKGYGKVLSPEEISILEEFRASVVSHFGCEMRTGVNRIGSTTTMGPGEKGDPDKASFAMQSMCVQVLQKCFTGGRYYNGQSLARIDQREKKGKTICDTNSKTITWDGTLHVLKKNTYSTIEMDAVTRGNGGRATVYNMDATDFVRFVDGDVELAYFDPPYGGDSSDYALMYGACEGFLRGKPVKECEELLRTMSKFKGKDGYASSLKELLDGADRFPTWLLSFNESSFASLDDIEEILKSFGRDVVVRSVDDYGYNYRKKGNKKESELMILARKP